LKAFGGTGGIEKFNRAMMKALEIRESQLKEKTLIYSAYDQFPDSNYYSGKHFKGFAIRKIPFTLKSILKGLSAETLLISHINLALIALVLQILNPRQKQILITHGIEVWGDLSWLKRKLLHSKINILSVSNYTRNILLTKHQIPAHKVSIFRNTLDPYFNPEVNPETIQSLRTTYKIPSDAKILMTIARLKNYEKAKGYDKVIRILGELIQKNKNTYYILAGKYSEDEHARIMRLATECEVADRIILPGFIQDADMPAHYKLADLFIMPSTKEGFGIVFIESMACGTPVIAGNKDGSPDTLLHESLGSLVDPDNLEQILTATLYWLEKGKYEVANFSHLVWDSFGFEKFSQHVRQL
jgi:phosphatidyl-myo-inositol dimannoside synthase